MERSIGIMINFKHSGGIGDIIYSIPAILSLLKHEKQAKFSFVNFWKRFYC